MKKTILLGALFCSAAAGYAQESRQDVSISGFGSVNPVIHGTGGIIIEPTITTGILASYRYLLTPRSALEVNYSFAQYTNKFVTSDTASNAFFPIHTRQQELSAAYVFGLSFKNYNPFLEGGVGGVLFTPILDEGTSVIDTKQSVGLGALFGGGLAYEVSPSFDIRVEYRGIVVKAPDFGDTDFDTHRYELLSMPAIGVAYHF